MSCEGTTTCSVLSCRSCHPPASFVGFHSCRVSRRIARVIVFQLSRLCIAMRQRRAVSVIGPPPMGELPIEHRCSRSCYRPCFTPRDGFGKFTRFPTTQARSLSLSLACSLAFFHIFIGSRNARIGQGRSGARYLCEVGISCFKK